MSKASQVAITYSATGDGMTLTFATTAQENLASPGEQQPLLLATGDNTIAVPTGAKGVIVVPPSASVIVKKLKGIGGDTGFILRAASPSYLALPDSTATILLNASAGETVSLVWV